MSEKDNKNEEKLNDNLDLETENDEEKCLSKIDDIVKHILYIEQLRKDYPNYAAQNDYIQKHRKFFRKCKSSHSDCEEFYIKAELCGMLKLPNTTDCGFGGGDYEIKKTPKRVKDFKSNIDNLCLFMSDCIAELRQMKHGIEELEEDSKGARENE